MHREDLQFTSGTDTCAAWLYRPVTDAGARPVPVVVLGIGLGSIRAMGLDRYAERFAEHGFAALAFDYRWWGDSGGEPRHVIDVPSQLQDWRAAIDFARSLPGVDPDRVIVWGTSFGGGHALSLAAQQPAGVVAAVAQCPFTDGIASALAMSPISALKVGWRAILDIVGSRFGRAPVTVPTAGPPHSGALMTAPDALPGFRALLPAQQRDAFANRSSARIGLRIMAYRPGRAIRRTTVPMFAAVCLEDSVAPPRPTLRHLRRAGAAEFTTYRTGHFAIYLDPWFEPAVRDQLEFMRRHV